VESRVASPSISGVTAATALVTSGRAAGSPAAGMARRGRGGKELGSGGGGAEEAKGLKVEAPRAGEDLQSLDLWPNLLHLRHRTGSLQTSARCPPARQRKHLPLSASVSVERSGGERVAGRHEFVWASPLRRFLRSTSVHPPSSSSEHAWEEWPGMGARTRAAPESAVLPLLPWEGAPPLPQGGAR
jgi:hypothetical protein